MVVKREAYAFSVLSTLWSAEVLRTSEHTVIRTCVPEALHAEINKWFHNQSEIYSTTVELQLGVSVIGAPNVLGYA